MKYKNECETEIRRRLNNYGDMLSTQDVADILGVAKECARCRIDKGQIKSVLIVTAYVVVKEWLIEYLDAGHSVRE